MDLMFGLSVVDQMNGGRQTKQLAEGWAHRSPRPSGRLRARVGAALIALGTRLAPVTESPAESTPAARAPGPAVAGGARS